MIIKLNGREIEIRDEQIKVYEDITMTSLEDMIYTFINANTACGYQAALVECTDNELKNAVLKGMKQEIELYEGIFPE